MERLKIQPTSEYVLENVQNARIYAVAALATAAGMISFGVRSTNEALAHNESATDPALVSKCVEEAFIGNGQFTNADGKKHAVTMATFNPAKHLVGSEYIGNSRKSVKVVANASKINEVCDPVIEDRYFTFTQYLKGRRNSSHKKLAIGNNTNISKNISTYRSYTGKQGYDERVTMTVTDVNGKVYTEKGTHRVK